MGTWEPAFDPDNAIKAIKEQRSFGPRDFRRPLCTLCGTDFVVHYTDDDWCPELCTSCLLRRMKHGPALQIVPEPARRRLCNRCCQARELVGAWCVPCRDTYQWRQIVELAKTERRTPDQQVALTNVWPYVAVWKQHESELREWGVWVDPAAVPITPQVVS